MFVMAMIKNIIGGDFLLTGNGFIDLENFALGANVATALNCPSAFALRTTPRH